MRFITILKRNIGLIEVMGLAVLPGRLKEELEILQEYFQEESIWKNKMDERVQNTMHGLLLFQTLRLI